MRTQYSDSVFFIVKHCGCFQRSVVQCDAKSFAKDAVPLNFNDCLGASRSLLHHIEGVPSGGKMEYKHKSSIRIYLVFKPTTLNK